MRPAVGKRDLSKALRETLQAVNRGVKHSPPLPRKNLDRLKSLGFVTYTFVKGLQTWAVTLEGKDHV